ncbi:hypothetical protein CMUS01_12297 [Colletotrichum musicola]|uniref:Uncharacterized protein n=1 Tax=Colletotrichum musicola TaxID=2175873 RepID=A0A8H6JN51_9PEZI|nr:hypothetical protein CMUS01_12297 [Colletotrichum musicola]
MMSDPFAIIGSTTIPRERYPPLPGQPAFPAVIGDAHTAADSTTQKLLTEALANPSAAQRAFPIIPILARAGLSPAVLFGGSSRENLGGGAAISLQGAASQHCSRS